RWVRSAAGFTRPRRRVVPLRLESLEDRTALSVTAVQLYVDGSAAAGGNGTKVAPFRTIQQAFAAVGDDTSATINVAAGTYAENVGSAADLFGSGREYHLLGGWDHTFTQRDQASSVRAANPAEPVFDFYNAPAVAIDGFDVS